MPVPRIAPGASTPLLHLNRPASSAPLARLLCR